MWAVFNKFYMNILQRLNEMYYVGPIQQKKDHISACIAAAQQTKDMIQQLPKLYDVQIVSVGSFLTNCNYRRFSHNLQMRAAFCSLQGWAAS